MVVIVLCHKTNNTVLHLFVCQTVNSCVPVQKQLTGKVITSSPPPPVPLYLSEVTSATILLAVITTCNFAVALVFKDLLSCLFVVYYCHLKRQ